MSFAKRTASLPIENNAPVRVCMLYRGLAIEFQVGASFDTLSVVEN
jgi:hypothetical protein